MFRNPWIFVVVVFTLVIGAWGTFIYLAGRQPMEPIPVETHEP